MLISTDRLFLREMEQSDFRALSLMLQDEDVMTAYEKTFSDEEVQVWLDKQLKNYRDNGFGLWAVVLKETQEMIGQCGLTIQEYNCLLYTSDAADEEDSVDLGGRRIIKK